MSKEPFSHPVSAGRIPPAGKQIRIEADATERQRLAEAMGIPAVDSLVAEIDLRPIGTRSYELKGTLTASVVQTDVVTLEPIAQQVAEKLDLVLMPAEDVTTGPEDEHAAVDMDAAEEVELYQKGRIDLGRILSEHLALGLDPYPRASGVAFEGYVEADPKDDPSPFDALASLKRPES